MNTLEKDINNCFKSQVANYRIMIDTCKIHFDKTKDPFWSNMISQLREKQLLALSQLKHENHV